MINNANNTEIKKVLIVETDVAVKNINKVEGEGDVLGTINPATLEDGNYIIKVITYSRRKDIEPNIATDQIKVTVVREFRATEIAK